MLVFGTRPEAIKMCPLVKELQTRRSIETFVCVTGQHRQLLDQVLDLFRVEPDYDLNLMRDGQTLFDLTSFVLSGIRGVLDRERPDTVLVHGDTSTSFAAALACFFKQIPVGHVEAGLRTFRIDSPFPEEFNRRAVGLVSRFHFAPTETAARNLIREGKDTSTVFVTGNTVVDAMRYTVREDFSHPELDWASGGRLILLTVHRRENLGAPMRRIFRALKRALQEHPECRVLYPVHPNPMVRRIAREELGDCPQVHLTEPLDAAACHNFEARCDLCLTDSGGLQEECPAFGCPVLVLRDTTERPEGVEAGVLRLTGTKEESVYRHIRELLEDRQAYERMARACNPFGDGLACRRIADVLEFGNCEPWMDVPDGTDGRRSLPMIPDEKMSDWLQSG